MACFKPLDFSRFPESDGQLVLEKLMQQQNFLYTLVSDTGSNFPVIQLPGSSDSCTDNVTLPYFTFSYLYRMPLYISGNFLTV